MNQVHFAPGTVVKARNRLWRVDAQLDEVLTATSIDSGEAEQRRFYLPFERVERGELAWPSPEIVGSPAAQELLLRAYRLSLLHGTAPLLSLQRSRVIPKDYQLVPVVMALETPRVRLLLADDVGLGKTIEAGLILTELLARQLASRVLVIVPANLREQWREALDYFFHLPARIISTRHRREMERELPPGANPWAAYRTLITSVDYAKRPAIKNQILEQSWDVVLCDEAHQVAKPHQSGPDEHVSMDRWELARALAASDRVRHLLLLTATPHNGYTDTFASLLRMLDVGAVQGPAHAPVILREVAARHVCQRRRVDVERWSAAVDPSLPARAGRSSPFPERDQAEVIVAPSAYEKEAVDAVKAYGEEVLSSAATGTAQARTLANWTVLHLHKRALSSPAALRASLKNRRERLRQQLEEGLGEGATTAAVSPEVARAAVLDEDTGEWLTDEEAGERTERAVYGSPEAIERELARLEEVLARAERVTSSRDSKLQKLLDSTLRRLLAHDPKVVIFTRYVDTMAYLAEQIARHRDYARTTVLTIHGGLNERQRGEVFHDFDRAEQAVLVATDAISEGINLQHAAAQVIHYELPWNPNRLEQRNGRVDRFGQPQPVVRVRTMVMDETLDAAILKVLVEKATQIRRDYGFSPPYFGEHTQILDLISEHEFVLGPRQLGLFEPPAARRSAPQEDPFAEETLERIRSESFYGQTQISLPEIERRLRETEATVGAPEEIQRFVLSGLNRFGGSVSANADGTWRVHLQGPALGGMGGGEVLERATFDPALGLDDPDVTVLDLGHPLVRRLVEVVKQGGFVVGASAPSALYGRTSYRVTPVVEEVTVLFHLLARYVVRMEPTSIVEELLPVAVPVYALEPAVVTDERTRALLAAEPAPQTRAADEVEEVLEDAFAIPRLEDLLAGAVEGRRAALARERAAMRERLEAQEGTRATAWLRGIDDLAPGSFDVLAVTMLYPA